MTNKLHIVEDQSAQQQPTFPATNVQILAQGLAITTALAPGLTIGQMIDASTMDQICHGWLESRREIKRQQDLAAEVMRHPRKN